MVLNHLRPTVSRVALLVCCALAIATGFARPVAMAAKADTLSMYFIDVEGGQATLDTVGRR